MEFNAQIRKTIKAEQKEHVKAHLGRCVGVSVLAAVPLLLIAVLYTITVLAPTLGYVSLLDINDPYAVLYLYDRFMRGYMGLILILIVVGAPLSLGLMNFYIQLSRGEDPAIGVLFQPFSSIRTIWRSIRMQFCLLFRALLWMLIPCVVLIVLGVIMLMPLGYALSEGAQPGIETVFMFILWLILYAVGIFLCGVRVAAYNAGYVVLHNDETVGVWEATRRSNETFKGHYKDLLVFYLSYAPWYLVLIGIALIVITIAGAVAVFSTSSAAAGIFVLILYIAFIVFNLVFSAFVNAYENTSFLAIYEHLKADSNEV